MSSDAFRTTTSDPRERPEGRENGGQVRLAWSSLERSSVEARFDGSGSSSICGLVRRNAGIPGRMSCVTVFGGRYWVIFKSRAFLHGSSPGLETKLGAGS